MTYPPCVYSTTNQKYNILSSNQLHISGDIYIADIRLIVKIVRRKCSQLHGRFEISNLCRYIVVQCVSNYCAHREIKKSHETVTAVCTKFIEYISCIVGKGKVHPCTGTEALFRPYGQ